jgi:hypothetical protein
MPFLPIVKINGDWHIPLPKREYTECGIAIDKTMKMERVGGDTATIPYPSIHELCVNCFGRNK